MRYIIAFCFFLFATIAFLGKRGYENMKNTTIDLKDIYGVDSTEQVRTIAKSVANIANMGANKDLLYKFLLEIANQESKLGTVRYKADRGFGYGIWQFDKIAHKDVLQLLTKNQALVKSINLYFNMDILNTTYDELKTNAIKACLFARVFIYYRVKGAIGDTLAKRAQQWKTYYNSVLGAGTVEKYINTNKNLVY